MAYLSKEQYRYRREAAERRNERNEAVAYINGMSEPQAELISDMCRIRHEFHCNMDGNVFHGDDIPEIIRINNEIRASGLPYIETLPSDVCDFYEDFCDFDTLLEIEKVPEDDDEREEWYQEKYEEIYNKLGDLNDKIEKYLGEIDRKYKTSFAPSGYLRIF